MMLEDERVPAEFEVYRILADLRGCACVPPGVAGRIYRVLDHLRFEKGPAHEIAMLEDLSLALHRERLGLDGPVQFASHVNRIADAWLTTRIPEGPGGDAPLWDHPWLARTKS